MGNETYPTAAHIRPVETTDVPHVVTLVHELAAYEHAAEHCTLTTEQLHEALFGARPALFGHVAERDGLLAGFTLWFLNFSTWDGVHGIYLEDLYIRPEHRKAGLGRALLDELVMECARNGYSRLEWSVLNWNTPAIAFYRSLGAEPMDGWTVYRLSGASLRHLADTAIPHRLEQQP